MTSSDKPSGAAIASSAGLERLRILLIDDEAEVLQTMAAFLIRLGHSVTAVVSGEDALERLNLGLAVDMVILDLHMPGIGGRETLARIRAMHRTLPVLVSTGSPEYEAADLTRQFAAVSVRPKPLRLDELREELDAVIAMRCYA